ncbi:hypothetical protein [Abyssalbus ytuae]|uniref:Uncharacterized protein n=1 Tax=Abyssalbus ytuae TaxID=2926907 RepID=A0A9E7A0G2_9FLAO|nr:hypothetical protein [Abyssalbus ytuae]UOB18607.1 hypothetical protein MQE35_04785 [Abyssalbus ytuae]
MKKCQTEGCFNNAAKKRTYCNHCKNERYKNNDIYRYYYIKLKHNARRRGKEFTISLDYFKKFCCETEYIDKKGRTKVSLHIDRINENLGYIKGNLQVLENSKNVKKYIKWCGRDETGKDYFTTVINKPVVHDSSTPF